MCLPVQLFPFHLNFIWKFKSCQFLLLNLLFFWVEKQVQTFILRLIEKLRSTPRRIFPLCPLRQPMVWSVASTDNFARRESVSILSFHTELLLPVSHTPVWHLDQNEWLGPSIQEIYTVNSCCLNWKISMWLLSCRLCVIKPEVSDHASGQIEITPRVSRLPLRGFPEDDWSHQCDRVH